MNARRRRGRGFTLIEMVVTVAIIGVLAAAAVQSLELVVQRSREQDLRLALREMRKAIDAYKQAVDEGRILNSIETSGYPPTLRILVEGVPDARRPDKQKIYFLRRIPRDPFSNEPQRPPEETWGLRSYESEADAPAEGNDVFDVYTRATGVGLNGVPYREW